MLLHFQIDYRARFGETLWLLPDPASGLGPCPMQCRGAAEWHAALRTNEADDAAESAGLTYRYEVRCGATVIRREAGSPHRLRLQDGSQLRIDRWHDRTDDRPFRSTMFTEGVFARPKRTKRTEPTSVGPVELHTEIAVVRPAQQLVLVGDHPALGNWDPQHGLPFDDRQAPHWRLQLPVAVSGSSFTWKFVLTDRRTGQVIAWEEGSNRQFDTPPADAGRCAVEVAPPRFALEPWRGAGVAIPVFSLRSTESFGVGEFADLKLMIDWAAATGQSIIQILPVNDTTMSDTWQDSYPYNANSTFALHPQYIRLTEVGTLNDPAEAARFAELGRELNALPVIDYERVNRAKIDYLHAIYRQEGARTLASAPFRRFAKRNDSWLRPYALFCTLRSLHGTPDFSRWGDLSTYDPVRAAAFEQTHRAEIDYHRFVQFHLDRQLRAVRDYAHTRGVVLKGDIPIGISRTSVDAWASPELFHMDASAGAPPDDFAAEGQNWGFPTYDWERMSRDGYTWWRRRFTKMAEYFDAYRIDHILGFFRIWEVPVRAVNALLGRFSPALPYTADEIAAYGFRFDRSRHTAPVEQTDNVLFVADERQPDRFHPRITAQYTPLFRSLEPAQQEAYNRLYDDFFYRRHNDFWREEALRKLPPLIAATGMLVCGEDLGMIPHCVPDVMAGEQILSLEIQRMPKEFGVAFGDPARYPYLSVCTTSTHDMNPIRAWWEEDRAETQRFYTEMLGRTGEAPAACEPALCEQIVRQHLDSPAMLTILPWQDWMAIDARLRRPNPAEERINVPANSRHFWRYRMHLTLEELLAADDLNHRIRDLIRSSGR